MTVAEAYQIVKAFSTYFELTNLAETNHRKRRRRAALLASGASDKPGSLRGTLLRMREAGIDAEQALEWLRQVQVMPVFTAHPTDVARRVVHFKQRRIARELELLDRLPLQHSEALHGQDSILAEITALWQTDEVRRRKPTVLDEIKMGLDHYPDSLMAPLPTLYEDMAAAFRQSSASTSTQQTLPTMVRFGSWIGGDRDGNPYVTPKPPVTPCRRPAKRSWPITSPPWKNCAVCSPLPTAGSSPRSCERRATTTSSLALTNQEPDVCRTANSTGAWPDSCCIGCA